MNAKLRKAMFAAPGIAVIVCFSGLASKAGDGASATPKTDRPPIAANPGAGYMTAQSHVPGASVLCRLPIQIATWNIARPVRCN